MIDESNALGIARDRAAENGWAFGEALLAERFIPGRELTCAVMGDRALGVIEIVPAETLGFYNYEAKYAEGGSRHVLPAPVSPNVYQLVQNLALTAHRALGCRGVSRADFRFDDTPNGSGELVCLEVNTQPGMTATSLDFSRCARNEAFSAASRRFRAACRGSRSRLWRDMRFLLPSVLAGQKVPALTRQAHVFPFLCHGRACPGHPRLDGHRTQRRGCPQQVRA